MFASSVPQEESQIVPQALLIHISTLPSLLVFPPTSLTLPSVHSDSRVEISKYY